MSTNAAVVRHHHVLADGLDEGFFMTFEDVLGELADKSGLDLVFAETRCLGPNQEVHVYRQEGASTTVTVVEDHGLSLRYLIVEGTSGIAEMVGEFLTERLDVPPLSDWQAIAEQRLSGEPDVLIKVALASGGQPDETTLRLLDSALSHADREVRLKAVEAASLTQWSVLATPLARAYEQDSDPEVRYMAGKGLQLLIAANPGTPTRPRPDLAGHSPTYETGS